MALGALIISLLAFLRNRRFENENHIYRLKIEIYSKFLSELNSFLNKVEDYKAIIKIHNRDTTLATKENVLLESDKVDDLIFAFDDLIITNSLILPQTIIDELDNFSDMMYDIRSIEENSVIDEDFYNIVNRILDKLNESADKVNDLMRKDLHVVELNSQLYKRLKK